VTPSLDTLSPREREYLVLYAQGLTMKEIARQVNRSHRTIELVLTHAKERTAVKNLVQLVVMAAKAGWV
jgi:DNA-binding NarL/FixJ family response regulator